MTFNGGSGTQEIHDVRGFLEYLCGFLMFFMKCFLVARSYLVAVMDIKTNYRCSSYPRNEARVPILAFFDNFGHFSSCLFLHKPLA